MAKIYTCFSTDIIHEGHLHIIEEAKKYGDVYIGVLSDEATISHFVWPTVPETILPSPFRTPHQMTPAWVIFSTYARRNQED